MRRLGWLVAALATFCMIAAPIAEAQQNWRAGGHSSARRGPSHGGRPNVHRPRPGGPSAHRPRPGPSHVSRPRPGGPSAHRPRPGGPSHVSRPHPGPSARRGPPPRRGFYSHGGRRYYNGYRGWSSYRRGYRRYNGWWFPAAAFATGVAVGNATAAPARSGNAHVAWCTTRFRSYRAWDNTWQPYSGPRRQCISPYS